ncbi:MAG: helix-turn-helix domain-containing protein [Clostridiales bacterium]|nr:helix-turn-helix domain-containing protein [Clostridiales bacterium]
MSIGEKLRILRQRTKRTLKEQSETFGVSLNSVYRWEHNLAAPKRSILKKMADYYEVPMEWLLNEDAVEENIEINTSAPSECNHEQQLLRMYKKLSLCNKYKILGYIERIYLESLDEKGADAIAK